MEDNKFGVFIARLQPFHKGHEAVVNEILHDGLTPMIILGSSNISGIKNPFSIYQRRTMIGLAMPMLEFRLGVSNDYDSWDKWFEEIQKQIPQNAVIYVNNKPHDKIPEFTLHGKVYKDTFYNDIWVDHGYTVKEVTHPDKLGISHINATCIRRDYDTMKWALNPSVYGYIKSIKKET